MLKLLMSGMLMVGMEWWAFELGLLLSGRMMPLMVGMEWWAFELGLDLLSGRMMPLMGDME